MQPDTNATTQANDAPNPPRILRSAIRVFVFTWFVLIAIDTMPYAWSKWLPFKPYVNTFLSYLGLSQGDWPLFAPNPEVKNAVIIAEITDGANQASTWQSTDWSKASAWQKFYRFRHVNYYQRIVYNHYAISDLADYLHRNIPTKIDVVPEMRWDESNELMPPAPFVSPVLKIKLYQFQQTMILNRGEPLPKQEDTLWGIKNDFLVQKEYEP